MSMAERLENIRRLLRENYPDMVGDPESIPYDIDQEAQKALAELATVVEFNRWLLRENYPDIALTGSAQPAREG